MSFFLSREELGRANLRPENREDGVLANDASRRCCYPPGQMAGDGSRSRELNTTT